MQPLCCNSREVLVLYSSIMAARNAAITNLAWRFADSPRDPASQANVSAFSAAYVQSRAGVVAAVLEVGSLRGVTVVTVFGYMAHRDVTGCHRATSQWR